MLLQSSTDECFACSGLIRDPKAENPMPRVGFSARFGYAGLVDSSLLGAIWHDDWLGKDSMAATLLSISLSRRRRCKWIRSHRPTVST